MSIFRIIQSDVRPEGFEFKPSLINASDPNFQTGLELHAEQERLFLAELEALDLSNITPELARAGIYDAYIRGRVDGHRVALVGRGATYQASVDTQGVQNV